jgi:hypothetical protein
MERGKSSRCRASHWMRYGWHRSRSDLRSKKRQTERRRVACDADGCFGRSISRPRSTQALLVYQHRTVRGISFFFVGLDAMGDLTSILSVLFQPSLDVLGLIIYGVELTLWIGIFACGGYYNLRPWLQAKMNAKRSEDQRMSPAIALHDLPSSTSVFRTPSGYSNELRQRNATAAGELPT